MILPPEPPATTGAETVRRDQDADQRYRTTMNAMVEFAYARRSNCFICFVQSIESFIGQQNTDGEDHTHAATGIILCEQPERQVRALAMVWHEPSGRNSSMTGAQASIVPAAPSVLRAPKQPLDTPP